MRFIAWFGQRIRWSSDAGPGMLRQPAGVVSLSASGCPVMYDGPESSRPFCFTGYDLWHCIHIAKQKYSFVRGSAVYVGALCRIRYTAQSGRLQRAGGPFYTTGWIDQLAFITETSNSGEPDLKREIRSFLKRQLFRVKFKHSLIRFGRFIQVDCRKTVGRIRKLIVNVAFPTFGAEALWLVSRLEHNNIRRLI